METIGVIAGISGEILVRKLHEKGYRTALVMGKPGESGEDISDTVYVRDMREHGDIAEFFYKEGVKNVLIGTGHILALELAADLSERGFVLSNDVRTSLLAKDKIAYKEALERHGFSTPAFYKIALDAPLPAGEEVIAKVGLPCVVKSAIDRIYPQKVSDADALRDALQEVRALSSPILVEQFIQGTDTTIPIVAEGDTASAVMVSYYSKSAACHLKGFDTRSPETRLTPRQEETLKKYCEAAALATGMTGLCRVDAIMSIDGKIYILETNSVMVTGVHPNQIEYGTFFLEKERVDFAELFVNISLKKFYGNE